MCVYIHIYIYIQINIYIYIYIYVLCVFPSPTGVCETNSPFRRASALQSSGIKCSPAHVLALQTPMFPHCPLPRRGVSFTDTGMAYSDTRVGYKTALYFDDRPRFQGLTCTSTAATCRKGGISSRRCRNRL